MAALKNPYLSNDSQNFLLRKNYNVIKSPSKYSLYVQNMPTFDRTNNYLSKVNNQQSSTSLKISSVSSNLKNPFSSKTLGQRNENFPYYNGNISKFYTQKHLKYPQNNQLPFPSYNRPQSNRGASYSASKLSNMLSFSRRNLAVSNVGMNQASSSSLQKNINGVYRPHFVSPKQNNEWNTQKWRRSLEKQQRMKLQRYGSQALKYEIKINNNPFNNDYYSTQNKQFGLDNNKYKINLQKPKKQNKGKNIIFDDNDQQISSLGYTNNNKYHGVLNTTHQSSSSNSLNIPKDPDTYYNSKKQGNRKKFSDIREESEIQNLQSRIQRFVNDDKYMKSSLNNIRNSNIQNSESMMSDYKSIVKDDEYEINKFIQDNKYVSKYSGQKRIKKGPLDIDAFDNIMDSNKLMNESRQSKLQRSNKFNEDDKQGQFDRYKQNRNHYNQEYLQSQLYKNRRQKQKRVKFKQNDSGYNKQKKTVQSNIAQKDHPQKLQFRNKIYYRLKLSDLN